MVLTQADLTQIKNWLENNIDQVKTFIRNHDLLEQQNAQVKFDADKAVAQNWFTTTIRPTLTWNNTQTLDIQRVNILNDYNTVKNLLTTETDRFRLIVIREILEQANNRFKQIKRALNP